MHDAPSVSHPVGRSAFLGTGLLAAWLLGAACVAGLAGAGMTGWRLAVAVASLAGAGLWAAAWCWRLPSGELAWDGGGWRWSPAGGEDDAGAVAVALDLQRALLLHWRGDAASSWLWVERRHAPARWLALRRAVYSRANPDALPGAAPPSANP
jgi:hypothetical protein